MPLSLGSDLIATIEFTKSGVPANPSSYPVVTDAAYPDGSKLATLPALIHVRTGVYYAKIFTYLQSTSIGTYTAILWTDDSTVDEQRQKYEWPEVGVGFIVSPGGFVEFVSPVNLIQTEVSIVSGDTYTNGNRPLLFDWPSGGLAASGVTAKYVGTSENGAPTKILGTVLSDTRVMFELPVIDDVPQSSLLGRGEFAVSFTDGVEITTIAKGKQLVTIPIRQ